MKDFDIKQSWNKLKKNLSDRVAILDDSEIEGWVKPMTLEKFSTESVVIGGLNKFFCNWISKNREEILHEELFRFFKVYGLKNDFKLVLKVKHVGNTLKEEFQFSNFVNGNNSSNAFAASLYVAENIGSPKYNPLFLCGGVGLGKTHLMQAIGNKVLDSSPQLVVKYCTSEDFINDVVEGIRHQNMENVRHKYRTLDMLLVDDIQFLENKESTQEEFFHTFEALKNRGSQIVITADKYPRELKNIEERLTSRFSEGPVTKIDPPEFETRMAIIQNELSKTNMLVKYDVIEHIAHAIRSNVREIKGVLKLLEVEWSMLNQEITLDSARVILKDVLNLDKSPINVKDIIKATAKSFNVKDSDILSEKRDREITIARQAAMYISRELTDLSFPVIGRYFEKNHASVIQAHKKTKVLIEENPESRHHINSIMREITLK